MKIYAKRRMLALKIVYYGPGLSGKTTNLQRLHALADEAQRGDLIQLDTETERTLFFDYFPADFGRLGGYRIKLHFFSVPGQSFYRETRSAVLQGADAVVFVADSGRNRELANQLSLKDLRAQLCALGQEDTPVVFQWNKRDLKDAVSVDVLERSLNVLAEPSVSAVATDGEGVRFTQTLAVREALKHARALAAHGGLEAASG